MEMESSLTATFPLSKKRLSNNNPDAVGADETIIDRVASFIERFVFLQRKSLYHLIATWCVGTHVHPGFEYYPYLLACSPQPESGKSRLLEVLDLLVFESS